jgi:hypothetical protein
MTPTCDPPGEAVPLLEGWNLHYHAVAAAPVGSQIAAVAAGDPHLYGGLNEQYQELAWQPPTAN